MDDASFEPRKVDLRAVELLRASATLVGKDYPVFLALTTLALALGQLVPFQILLGPAMCGVYVAFRSKSVGLRPVLEDFVRGFDHFLDSLVATLVLLFTLLLLAVPPVFAYVGLAVLSVEVWKVEEWIVAVGSVLPALVIGVAAVLVVAAGAFLYPAIVDGADGLQALRASARGFWRNRWGVLRLLVLGWLVTLLGLCLCCIGAVLVQPFVLGATWLAYREIFPEAAGASAAR